MDKEFSGAVLPKFDTKNAPDFNPEWVQFDIGRLSGRELDAINDVLLERKGQFKNAAAVLVKYIKVAPSEWGDVTNTEVLYDLPRDYLNGMVVKLIGELNGKN